MMQARSMRTVHHDPPKRQGGHVEPKSWRMWTPGPAGAWAHFDPMRFDVGLLLARSDAVSMLRPSNAATCVRLAVVGLGAAHAGLDYAFLILGAAIHHSGYGPEPLWWCTVLLLARRGGVVPADMLTALEEMVKEGSGQTRSPRRESRDSSSPSRTSGRGAAGPAVLGRLPAAHPRGEAGHAGRKQAGARELRGARGQRPRARAGQPGEKVMGGLKSRPVVLDVRPVGWVPSEKRREREKRKILEEAETKARIEEEERRREQVAREAEEQRERDQAERALRQESMTARRRRRSGRRRWRRRRSRGRRTRSSSARCCRSPSPCARRPRSSWRRRTARPCSSRAPAGPAGCRCGCSPGARIRGGGSSSPTARGIDPRGPPRAVDVDVCGPSGGHKMSIPTARWGNRTSVPGGG
ncbi:unnamed protein product [Prorocentrum cordatum]|uniref:Uncharacterized protein n=1 Tax=Prorocentrum cordatum TaxID=2364126 RepID=A0ABN9PIM9_9DINO|nr:unnamed protein product [Polarella glacialis]